MSLAAGERAHYLPAEDELPKVAADPIAAPAALPQHAGSAKRSRSAWKYLFDGIAGELAKDSARGAAFLCLPVLMAAGAACYFSLTREPGAPELAFSLVVLATTMYLARGRPAVLLPLAAFFVFGLGVAAAKLETWRSATPMLGSEVTTRITGRLVQLEHQASGRVRLTIDVTATHRPELRYPPERVRLTARRVSAGLRPGDGVSGLVRLSPPAGPVRPGTYDFAFTSYFRGIDAVGFFMSEPERVSVEEQFPLSSRPIRWVETLRTSSPSLVCTWRLSPSRSWQYCARSPPCFPLFPPVCP